MVREHPETKTKFSRFRTQSACDMPSGHDIGGFGAGTETYGTNGTNETHGNGTMGHDVGFCGRGGSETGTGQTGPTVFAQQLSKTGLSRNTRGDRT